MGFDMNVLKVQDLKLSMQISTRGKGSSRQKQPGLQERENAYTWLTESTVKKKKKM